LRSSSLVLDAVVVAAIVLALVYRRLVTNPKAAVAGYKLLNKFDDATKFNLQEHNYLTGPYRPVVEETHNLETRVISGGIPKDLSGLFLRVGPNPLPEKIAHGYHWFDGDGMIHSIRVNEGKALYSNQYVETPLYKESKEHKGVVSLQLGELRGFVGILKFLYLQFILSKAIPLPILQNGAANTAINFYNNRIFLGYESNLPFEIRWKEDNRFDSVGYVDFNETLDYPFTAHPKKDPEDGSLYFNGYSVDENNVGKTMKYGKLHQNTIEEYFTIPLTIPTFAHDMSITKNYVLLYDSSIIFDKMEIIKDGQFYRLDQKKAFRVGILPKTAKSSNEIDWITFNEAFGIIHPLNAWEEPESNEIVIITPLSRGFNGFDARNHTNSMNNYYMTEIRINLQTKESKVTFLPDAKLVEFCNIHPKFLGRKAKYGFSGELEAESRNFHKIVKFNLHSPPSVAATISLPDDYVCGEPVLIPREMGGKGKGSGEGEDYSDHVYVGVFATNLKTMESEWMVYDGETMSEEAVLRLGLGGKMVPLGFHGLWIDEKDLQEHMRE